MYERRIQPNGLSCSVAMDGCEAERLPGRMPLLVRESSRAMAKACAAAAESFQEEDQHGDHAGLALVAAEVLAWQGQLSARLCRLFRRLCRPVLARRGAHDSSKAQVLRLRDLNSFKML